MVRGLHYQKFEPQGKLVRVVHGEVFDVAVDIRRSSSTFGKWFGVNLSAENKKQLWVPAGFAHGFMALSDNAEVLYQCTGYYSPGDGHTITWNDPAIGIEWPNPDGTPIRLSQNDAAGKLLKDARVFD